MTNRTTTKTTLSCDEVIQRLSAWATLKVSGDVVCCLSKGTGTENCINVISAGLYDGFYGTDEEFTSLVNSLFAGRKAHDQMRSVHLSGVREALSLAVATQKQLMAELQSVVTESSPASLQEVPA